MADTDPILWADPATFARHIEGERGWLTKYLRSRVSREEAEDIAQDTCLIAWEKRERYEGRAPFSQFLLGIADHLVLHSYRRGARSRPESLDAIYYHTVQRRENLGEPFPEMRLQFQRERLEAHMTAVCSPEEQQVLLLSFAGETPEQIALLLQKNDATVRSHLRRGRAKLLARLFEQDPEFLGGSERIQEALAAARNDPQVRLTPEEAAAFAAPEGRRKTFYEACLKIARFLVLAILAALGRRDG